MTLHQGIVELAYIIVPLVAFQLLLPPRRNDP